MATLVNHLDFFFRYTIIFNDVLLRRFTYGNNYIGIFTGILKLGIINQSIRRLVGFRIDFKNQIMNGYHFFGTIQTHRNLVA